MSGGALIARAQGDGQLGLMNHLVDAPPCDLLLLQLEKILGSRVEQQQAQSRVGDDYRVRGGGENGGKLLPAALAGLEQAGVRHSHRRLTRQRGQQIRFFARKMVWLSVTQPERTQQIGLVLQRQRDDRLQRVRPSADVQHCSRAGHILYCNNLCLRLDQLEDIGIKRAHLSSARPGRITL